MFYFKMFRIILKSIFSQKNKQINKRRWIKNNPKRLKIKHVYFLKAFFSVNDTLGLFFGFRSGRDLSWRWKRDKDRFRAFVELLDAGVILLPELCQQVVHEPVHSFSSLNLRTFIASATCWWNQLRKIRANKTAARSRQRAVRARLKS